MSILLIGAAAAESRDWNVLPDVGALRREFGERDDFYEVCEKDRKLREAFDAVRAKDWPQVLGMATPRLERCPVDIDFHLLRAIALEQTDREAEAAPHRRWHRALVDSVLKSGDGATPETAWVVISVPEEYAVMRALGMRRKQQTLIDGGIDALVVEVEGKPDQTIYFNPAAHFQRLMKKLR